MKMITKMTREEEKQGGTRDAQYYCSPSDKCSAPPLHPKSTPLPGNFSNFFIRHDILQCPISIWLLWVTCPGYAPSFFLVFLIGRAQDLKKVLNLV